MTLVDRTSAQGCQDSSRTRVLVVEDDPSTRAFIVNGLGSDGTYDFVEAASAEEAEAELAANRKIAILILDLGLPRISGLQLLRRLRTKPGLIEGLGVVIVTANNDREDRLLCLELGADHFVNKPVQLRELKIHVRNLVKRVRGSGEARRDEGLGFNGLVLWPDVRQVEGPDGAVIDLTRAEYELLRFLLANPTRAFTRDQLLDAISGPDGGPADRAIDNLVRRLRAKLGDDARSPNLIKTLHGHGYSMACPVERIDPSKRRSPQVSREVRA
jgi:DNA-binding response OmpR family regulator